MRVLFVASECFPLVKTGGLADVVGALPLALSRLGTDVRVLLPNYPQVAGSLGRTRVIGRFRERGGEVTLLSATAGGLNVIALDAPHLFDRPGTPYNTPEGQDWPDNHVRFATLAGIAARIACEGVDGWRPDVVHAHDWQAGLTPFYIRLATVPCARTVFTIHNMAYQGVVPATELDTLGIPSRFYTADGMEYWGALSLLKSGIVYSDRVTTVSPTYAQELRTGEFGMGLEGTVSARAADFSGILNGIDDNVWNPRTDKLLPATYSTKDMDGKAANKAALQAAFGLEVNPTRPVFAVISRLAYQKGLDILLAVLPELIERGGQLVLLGSGDPDLQRAYMDAAAGHPGRVGVRIGYDEPLSHLAQAGADAIIIPSRFEPCGLTQLYALRYGTLPIVARTGGLADTVIDANDAALARNIGTGFVFYPVNADRLRFAVERAIALWYGAPDVWQRLRANAMAQPVGWRASAERYLELYRSLPARGPEPAKEAGKNGAAKSAPAKATVIPAPEKAAPPRKVAPAKSRKRSTAAKNDA
ncbi:MAG: glycogen synthase GlgA [Hyphomicrobiales bacterium]